MNNEIEIPGCSWHNIQAHCNTSGKHIWNAVFIENISYFLEKRKHKKLLVIQRLPKQKSDYFFKSTDLSLFINLVIIKRLHHEVLIDPPKSSLKSDPKNPVEPKVVVKNRMRSKTAIEFLGLWEELDNSGFKGVEFATFHTLKTAICPLNPPGANSGTVLKSGSFKAAGRFSIFKNCE